MMRTVGCIFVSLICVFSFGCAKPDHLSRDTVFQVSSLSRLKQSHFEGFVSYTELKRHGNFGIGTFSHLDGEMIALEGQYFRLPINGKPEPILNNDTAPFATVTFFDSDQTLYITDPLSYENLQSYLDSVLTDKNSIYAIKISGRFQELKARSVVKLKKPYPTFESVLDHQVIFDFGETEGYLVGFWSPQSLHSILFPGYHFHFISEDKSQGGHVLDFQMVSGEISIDKSPNLLMITSSE
ncbi:MAG: acetolactate decarboxylase [Candidatus Margulisbacteria bacterium]|nr:acetolactate decarboxylase [Candidatus Margulisiibacteriota bacterium]